MTKLTQSFTGLPLGAALPGDVTITLIETKNGFVETSDAAKTIAWEIDDAHRVIQINTAEGWANDISHDVAERVFEIRTQACIDPENPLGDALDFVQTHMGCDRVERMLCEWSGQ